MRCSRSPDGASARERDGEIREHRPPHSASLHAGYTTTVNRFAARVTPV